MPPERQAASEQDFSPPQRSDYIRALQRIGLGHDTTASARDQLQALEKLVEIDSEPGQPTTIHFHIPAEMAPRKVGDPPRERAAGDGNETHD